MYNVLIDFSDPVNGGVYRKGGTYPRAGVMPTDARVEYLLGNSNKFGKPVIETPEAETPPVRFQCPHCEKDYANASGLASHVKDKHPEAETPVEE